VQLVDHGVDCFFQKQNFAADVDRDLLGQVAVGDGGGDFSDVSHLAGEVRSHGVHRVGQVFPGSADARHLGLSAELAVSSDLASITCDFRREGLELVDHGVEGFFELQDFAAHVDGDLAGQVAASHSGCYFRNVSDLSGQVAGHEVNVVGEIFPGSG